MELQSDIVQMLVEHVQIRRLVGDLAQQTQLGQPSTETMVSLGNLLHNHIRHEEDVLFPIIERTVPEAALAELPSDFASFEGAAALTNMEYYLQRLRSSRHNNLYQHSIPILFMQPIYFGTHTLFQLC